MDGARFANALVATGLSPAEMTWKRGVDILSFGGTKNGCLGVEAVILFDPARAWEFELRRKRGGHLFSKHRFLSAQMEAYLEGDQTEALQRVVSGVERSRYAPPGSTVTDIRTDTQTVVKAVSGVRRRKDRLRATWWPTEGLLEWRDRRAAVARVVRRPLDRFRDWRDARRDFRR